MSTLVLTAGSVKINSVDLSAWVKSASLDYSAESIDETAFGDSQRMHIGGLKAWSGQVELMQDYANSAVDQTLWSLVGTIVSVYMKATQAANSSTNPEFQGNALITAYNPVGGSVGDLHTTRLSFVSAGALTRATS